MPLDVVAAASEEPPGKKRPGLLGYRIVEKTSVPQPLVLSDSDGVT
jgi:hypothetical protein